MVKSGGGELRGKKGDRVLAAVASAPGTALEIGERCGIPRRLAHSWLRALWCWGKCVRIGRKPEGRREIVYGLPGRDAPDPELDNAPGKRKWAKYQRKEIEGRVERERCPKPQPGVAAATTKAPAPYHRGLAGWGGE